MQSHTFKTFDPTRVPSPCFVIDEVAIENNLTILDDVQKRSGAKILAALKAFSCWSLAPLMTQYLSGTCASGYSEARLGHDEFSRNDCQELHVFSPAFSEQEFTKILPLANHIVFNSLTQWDQFKNRVNNSNIACGLRINPQHSEATTEIYDPCASGSRLGIPIHEFKRYEKQGGKLAGISGLHCHTLCEQGLDPLRRTLAVIEEKFADYLPHMQWVNFGGGHHITDPDYDVEGLIELINTFAKKYSVQVYLEPGEAIAIRSGVLVSEVLDVMQTDTHQHAILDTSATCHMPDTLEMPYRANILHARNAHELAHTYRLGGLSCLAGDNMGDYSFAKALQVGDRLLFDDMAHYTMVKTNTFNGVQLPSIAIWNSQTDALRIVRRFDYEDFKQRLS